jgi:hypothetical protein
LKRKSKLIFDSSWSIIGGSSCSSIFTQAKGGVTIG